MRPLEEATASPDSAGVLRVGVWLLDVKGSVGTSDVVWTALMESTAVLSVPETAVERTAFASLAALYAGRGFGRCGLASAGVGVVTVLSTTEGASRCLAEILDEN